MKSLSETRWESRVDAVKSVRHQIFDIYISIVEDDSLNGQVEQKLKLKPKVFYIKYLVSNFYLVSFRGMIFCMR